jgi:hypothetical protein
VFLTIVPEREKIQMFKDNHIDGGVQESIFATGIFTWNFICSHDHHTLAVGMNKISFQDE